MNDWILEILKDIRPELDFTQSLDFIHDGLLDSFDILMLVSALDKVFGISIDGIEIVPENFSNIDNIQNLLVKYGVQ